MLLHRLLPRPTPLLTLPIYKHKSLPVPFHTTSFFTLPSTSSRPILFSSSIRSLSSSQSLLELPKVVVSETELESEDGENGAEEDEIVTEGLEEVLERDANQELRRRLPILTVKEKKELASHAHSLGKKLKSQQVGKSGVTDTVLTALIETLEANELLKLKIHNSCPGELEDVVKQLEEGTGSVVVGQIGRTVILYRPSLTKMKVEQKKQAAQRILMKKQTVKQSQSKTTLPRQSSRGRRGSSRFGA